jgi:hypothetical protein
MSWYNYVACFLAGAFLANVVPHFFPRHFGRPLSHSVRQSARTRIVVGGLKICPPNCPPRILGAQFELLHENISSVIKDLQRRCCLASKRSAVRARDRPPLHFSIFKPPSISPAWKPAICAKNSLPLCWTAGVRRV